LNRIKLAESRGYFEGEGPDPLEAANSIMRMFDIPYSGWDGQYEYFDDSGSIIEDKEFDEHGGNFSAVFQKGDYLYTVSGTVWKEGRRWKAQADTEKVDL
jgi:hypothetical protein